MSDETFSISEVAAMVGLTAHTIRAWEKRYGVPRPARTASTHRRYTMDDVEVLRRVKQGVSLKGLSLKLAARWAEGDLPETELEAREPAGPATAPGDLPAEDAPWRAMADLSPSPMVIVANDGRIVDANIAFARAAGVVRGGLRNTRFADLIDPHDRAKAVTAYRPPLRQRRGWELNVRTKVVAGLYSFDCWPLRWGEDWLLGMIGRDLTGEAMEEGPAGDDAR